MILVTTQSITGKRIVKTLGLVRGNTIRACHMGHDIMAEFKNFVGGEIDDYTAMMSQAREQALDRMIANAEALGANAIIGVHFATCSTMQHTAELLAYGTAVIIEDE